MATYELGLTIVSASDPPISPEVPRHYLPSRLECSSLFENTLLQAPADPVSKVTKHFRSDSSCLAINQPKTLLTLSMALISGDDDSVRKVTYQRASFDGD